MSDYQGMRWFKCDLQVQTPEDARHWNDADLQLHTPRCPVVDGERDESDIQEKARVFLRRCHELELNTIGVTDHNFCTQDEPRDWFLTHLVEQNRSVARDLDREAIAIFPGFEVDIGYHVLCLFDPARKLSHLRRVSGILTKLGLLPSDRFRSAEPQPLRFNGQTVTLKTLLEVVQGEHGGIVIAAHADRKDGIFESSSNIEDYCLPDLHCVELAQLPLAKRIADILSRRNSAWSRKGPSPAMIQSSDAKSLAVDSEGNPLPNALGYRHTWIKMSKPSIEALRQAFLDGESRIRLVEDAHTDRDPAERQHHARLLSVEVSGVEYLDDLSFYFSPNLNCIIGGRGSGKSTLLEYLRMALRKDRDASVREKSRTREKIDRIKETISDSSACVRVRWRSRDRVEDSLVYTALGGASVENREIQDVDTFYRGLPVRFFSQQQLTELTAKEGNNLLPLVDAFVRAELDELEAEVRELRAEIGSLFQIRRQRTVVAGERDRLRQEVAELTRQRSARAGLQEAAQAHQRLQDERKLSDRVRADLGTPEGWVELAEDFAESHSPLGSLADDWPDGPWFRALDTKVEEAKQQLLKDVKAAVGIYRRSVEDLFDKDPEWPGISAGLDKADAEFQAACEAQGLTPAEVSRVQEIDRDLRAKQAELDGKQRRIEELDRELIPLPEKQTTLLKLWRCQFRKREFAAAKAKEAEQSPAARFLDISVLYGGHRPGFDAAWERLAPPDRRKPFTKAWGELGGALFVWAKKNHADSPWKALEDLLSDPKLAPSLIRRWAAEISTHLQSESVQPTWEEVQLVRVEDQIDLTLYREDGSCAGSVLEGGLSDGQRNTAALALLLAQGDDPIVIDQPEDELDSNFIYRDLVPMLRAVKEQRQLIFATHNANLPVNGDAELVYALQSQGGRGKLRAQGGLDLAKVSDAVLDVMEGSREAFQKRREKYHF